jgi:copper chaperone CopZ
MKVLYLIFLLVLQERRYLAVLPCEMGEGLPQDIVKASSVLHYTLIDRAQKNTTDNVLTRENIMVILQRKNIDPTKCSEASCAVEYARLLGADRVVTCSILRVKNINYIYLHLYETETGRVLNSVEEKTPGDVEEVIEIVGSLGERIFTGEAKKKEVMEEKKEKKEIIKPEKKIEGRKGILYITSEPSGAMIIVDERDTGEKTPTMIEMDEGWHEIKLIKEGYAWNKRIYVKSGEKNDIEAVLEKEKEVMLLKVESEPSGADVYIDGAYYGKTPLFTKVISVEHKIKIKKEGYKTEERVVPVPPDKKALLRVKLEPKTKKDYEF